MVYLLKMVIFHGKLLVITRWYESAIVSAAWPGYVPQPRYHHCAATTLEPPENESIWAPVWGWPWDGCGKSTTNPWDSEVFFLCLPESDWVSFFELHEYWNGFLPTSQISISIGRPPLPRLCLGARMTDAVEWATMKASQGIISGEINQHWLFCIPIQVGPATDHARNLRHWFALIIAPWEKCGWFGSPPGHHWADDKFKDDPKVRPFWELIMPGPWQVLTCFVGGSHLALFVFVIGTTA